MPKERTKPIVTTVQLREAVAMRWPDDAYAVIWECGNATGSHCYRHADAIVASLWPSRGLWLHGLELKASRSDWKKELDNPGKAETIWKYCDYWSVVVGDRSIVQPGELPAGWGLFAFHGGSLRCDVEAKRAENPKPLDRSFVMAICRASQKPMVNATREALKEQWNKGYEYGKNDWKRAEENLIAEIASLKAFITQFEQAAGIHLNAYSLTRYGEEHGIKVGEIVNRILKGRYDDWPNKLDRLRDLAAGIVADIDKLQLPDENDLSGRD